MGDLKVWFAMHAQTMLLIGLACLLIGLSLFLIGFLLRQLGRRHSISASNGGVVVGRDNSGTIITDGIGIDKTKESNNLLTTIASWVTIIGFPLALAGTIVAILAWKFPVQP